MLKTLHLNQTHDQHRQKILWQYEKLRGWAKENSYFMAVARKVLWSVTATWQGTGMGQVLSSWLHSKRDGQASERNTEKIPSDEME